MVKASNLTKGMYIIWNNQPTLVQDKEFYNPGKGAAVARTKFLNLVTGKVSREVIKSEEMIQDIDIFRTKVQYLFKNGNYYVFMNPETFEQLEVSADILEHKAGYLKEGGDYSLSDWENRVLDVILPLKDVYKITSAEIAIRGDTAAGSDLKNAALENGTVVRVPLFIKEGEEIYINTETGEYCGRSN